MRECGTSFGVNPAGIKSLPKMQLYIFKAPPTHQSIYKNGESETPHVHRWYFIWMLQNAQCACGDGFLDYIVSLSVLAYVHIDLSSNCVVKHTLPCIELNFVSMVMHYIHSHYIAAWCPQSAYIAFTYYHSPRKRCFLLFSRPQTQHTQRSVLITLVCCVYSTNTHTHTLIAIIIHGKRQ